MTTKRKILVALDGSESSGKAAHFAGELARDTGAELLLLHVYDAPAAVAMGLIPAAPAQLDDSMARRVQGYFHNAGRIMGDVQVAQHLVEIGNPAERIVTVAREQQVTQVVMGSRGLSPIKELLLGSVSERVSRDAHCAVTIVR
jgi:nucleotide-binding universal stress UspA family protein